MPENVFRLMVVGLLFLIAGLLTEPLLGRLVLANMGSAFVIFGFLAWIQERRGQVQRARAVE